MAEIMAISMKWEMKKCTCIVVQSPCRQFKWFYIFSKGTNITKSSLQTFSLSHSLISALFAYTIITFNILYNWMNQTMKNERKKTGKNCNKEDWEYGEELQRNRWNPTICSNTKVNWPQVYLGCRQSVHYTNCGRMKNHFSSRAVVTLIQHSYTHTNKIRNTRKWKKRETKKESMVKVVDSRGWGKCVWME